MDKQAFSELLQELVDEVSPLAGSEYQEDPNIAIDWQDVRVRTFNDIGLLTTDTGLHIMLADGSQFYLTIQEAN